MYQKSAFHILYSWRNDCLNMAENGQLVVHAQAWQISLAHSLKSTKNSEQKFSVYWSIMLYIIFTSFRQIWRGSSWNIFQNQDVWYGMTQLF